MRPDIKKYYDQITDDENEEVYVNIDNPTDRANLIAGLEDLSKEPSVPPMDSISTPVVVMKTLALLLIKLSGTSYKTGDALKFYNTIVNCSDADQSALRKMAGNNKCTHNDLLNKYKEVENSIKVDSPKAKEDTTGKKDKLGEKKPTEKKTKVDLNTKKTPGNTLATSILDKLAKLNDQAKVDNYTAQVNAIKTTINNATNASNIDKAIADLKSIETKVNTDIDASSKAADIVAKKQQGNTLADAIINKISNLKDPGKVSEYTTQITSIQDTINAATNASDIDKAIADLNAIETKVNTDIDAIKSTEVSDSLKQQSNVLAINILGRLDKLNDQDKVDNYTAQVKAIQERISKATTNDEVTNAVNDLNNIANTLAQDISESIPAVTADRNDEGSEEGNDDITLDGTQTTEPAPAPTSAPKPDTEPESEPAKSIDNNHIDPVTSQPAPVDNRTKYKKVYDLVDTYAMSTEQAEMAKRFVDIVLDEPDNPKFTRAYNALTGKPGSEQNKCIFGLLTQADPKLGYRSPASNPTDSTIPFAKGVVNQSHAGSTVQSALVMPDGFAQKKNSVIWNTPVITDFGFPFLNFSSEAMLNIIKSKEDDENIKNANLKTMFKDAAKKLGGIWKAIYASPLALLRQIASEIGTKCTPNYIKIDSPDLLDSESGDTVNVFPIKYYSIEPEYEPAVMVPRDFLTSFYEVMDYTTTSKKTYLKYAFGMSADDFADEIDENNGIPPFYILIPKAGKFSKCEINPGSLFGSLLNLILGRKKCTMVKTMFMGKRGCLAMETDIADKLYADT